MLNFNEAMVEGRLEDVTGTKITIEVAAASADNPRTFYCARVNKSVAAILPQFIGRKVIAAIYEKPTPDRPLHCRRVIVI